MDQARTFMEEENYQQANVVFRKILSLNAVIPNDMSYLFAETLYVLGQYKNSQNFLTKYLTLTGRTGSYYQEALDLQELLDGEMRAVRDCEFCNGNGFRLAACSTCKETGYLSRTCTQCRGVGKVQCRKCLGEGVIISLDALGQRKYETCDNCDSKGIHECPSCLGKKFIEATCPTCLGTKKMQTSVICNHQPLAQHDHEDGHDEEGQE